MIKKTKRKIKKIVYQILGAAIDVPEFVEETQKDFQYLINDFGFRIVSAKKDKLFPKVTYQSDTRAVMIHYEGHEDYLYINLYHLINGELPMYDDPVNFVPLNLLAKKRLGNSFDEESLLSKNYDYTFALKNSAEILKEVGSDILGGVNWIGYEELSHLLPKVVFDKKTKNWKTWPNSPEM